MKPPSLVSRSDQLMPNFCKSAGVTAAKLAKLPTIQLAYAIQNTAVKASANFFTSVSSASAPAPRTTNSAR